MGIKLYRPTSSARRHTSVLTHEDITRTEPEKSLVYRAKRHAGRNAQGKITVRHQGGGNKKKIRIVDFKRDKYDIPATVDSIEYDSNRNARLALLIYKDGEKRYMVAPQGLKVGDVVMSSQKLIELKSGNHMPIEFIPQGMFLYNIELEPGKGGQIARSAGIGVYLMNIEGGHAQLKMPSGEIRLVSIKCLATIGSVSNPDYQNVRWGKAGRMRHRGIRPTVRGKVMNPVDHPHGGGEGRNPIGMKAPKTPWGKPALGVKTRKPNKKSQALILQRRRK